ncbi:MAG TPA: ABC transporter ATP-binding protein [Trinickia sp.]
MVKLSLDRVGAAYGSRRILSDISTVEFHGGQVVAVVGPNAAGKSTLFKRIAGLVGGPGSVRLKDLRRGSDGICYMPQDAVASPRLTVYESMLLARKQQDPSWTVHDGDMETIDAIMGSMGIDDLAFRSLEELSGGQRQLVSIAQTLARDPDIMLLDEPTSALDMRRQVQVLGFIRALAKARSMLVFIAIHDLNQALRFADQVLVIADGTARGSGACEDIITADMLRDVYRIDARVERCSMGARHVIVDGAVRSGEGGRPHVD